jgi:predicted phage replisome organizer
MANNPKMFYWLRLREDFFISNPYVKKLLKMEHGDSLALLYLRIQTYSLKNNCIIHYQGIEETLAEEIAFIVDADPEIAKTLVDFLLKYKLLTDLGNNDYLLTEAVDATGKETENAQMNRNRREKEKTESAGGNKNNDEGNIVTSEGNTETIEGNIVTFEGNKNNDEGNIVTSEGNKTEKCYTEKRREEKRIEKSIEEYIGESAAKEQHLHPLEQKLIDLYHEKCPSLPKVYKMTDPRRRAIKAMFKKYSLETFGRAYDIAERSSFLKGECNGKGHEKWRASFDFFLKEQNLVATLEGQYSGNGSGAKVPIMDSGTDYSELEALEESYNMGKAQN